MQLLQRRRKKTKTIFFIYNKPGVEHQLNPGNRHLYTWATTAFCRISSFLEIIVFGIKK